MVVFCSFCLILRRGCLQAAQPIRFKARQAQLAAPLVLRTPRQRESPNQHPLLRVCVREGTAARMEGLALVSLNDCDGFGLKGCVCSVPCWPIQTGSWLSGVFSYVAAVLRLIVIFFIWQRASRARSHRVVR